MANLIGSHLHTECWRKQTAQSKPPNRDSNQVKESSAVSFEILTAHLDSASQMILVLL